MRTAPWLLVSAILVGCGPAAAPPAGPVPTGGPPHPVASPEPPDAEQVMLRKELTELLTRIDTAVAALAAKHEWPLAPNTRNAGATLESIVALEQRIGATLPADLRALLLLHDGATEVADQVPVDAEKGGAEALGSMPLGLELVSVAQLTFDWNLSDRVLTDAVKRGAPFEAETGCQDEAERVRWSASPPTRQTLWFVKIDGLDYGLWVDLKPGPNGTRGQVIYNSSEIDMVFIAPSVRDFLRRYAETLEAGKWHLEDGALTPKDGDLAALFAKR